MPSFGLILIGDELLSGRTQDTNGHWLAQTLQQQGQNLKQIQVISDDLEIITQAIDQALKNYDVVITSGGIGPTEDDRTKAALCRYLKVELQASPVATQLVTQQYQRINRSWTPETNNYHLLPEGITPVFNPKGLAPGLQYQNASKMLLAAPGVPREFQAMVEQQFLPVVYQHFKTPAPSCAPISIRTREIPEEKIFFELMPKLWQTLERFGKVSSLPQTMGVDIVVTPHGTHNPERELRQLLTDSPLEPYIWQWGELSLPAYIISEARAKKLKIGIAESCTGGLTASRLTDIPGSSQVFQGSVVTYANTVKTSLLNVQPSTLKKHGAVSEATALEMARGALEKLECDLALAYSGIAGPGGGSTEKPVGTVAIAIAAKRPIFPNHADQQSWWLYYPGDRLRLKQRFSEKGLYLLLAAIKSY